MEKTDKKTLIKDGIFLLILIFIDQFSKYFVFKYPIDNLKVINDFFYISKVKNTGAAWGLFAGQMWLFYLISLIALYFLCKLYLKCQNRPKYLKAAVILLFAGTLGNLLDRLFLGYVRDFLNFIIFTYDYPVFNFADMILVVGVGLIIFYVFRHPDEEFL